MKLKLFFLASACFVGLAVLGANPLIYPTEDILSYARALEPRLTEIRRDLHRNPELGFEEFRTTAKIREILSTLPGVEIREIPFTSGVVAEIKGTKPELGTIGLRCDIDALPIQEDKPASHTYKSTIPGKMHACGHDGHIAINLGAAMILSKFRPEHSVRFIFQPAEEIMPSGAPVMIRLGAADGLKMIWGFHINATSDFGNVGWYDGIVMAGGYTLDIRVKGKSAHTAYPEYSVNPIVVLSRVAVAIDGLKQTIRATRPYSVSMMHMDCPNVAHSASPAEGRLIVKTRYHEPEVNDLLVQKIRQIVKMYSDLYGATFEIAEEQGLAPTYNLEAMGPLVRENATALGLPLEHIFASMGGDDFGCYGWTVPAYYMTFGLRTSPDFPIAHTAKFDWDEKILPSASAMFASCALREVYPELPQPKVEPKISVFAYFIRDIAKQRKVSKQRAAEMLYGLGVRGFDIGPEESDGGDLAELAATPLKPINFYFFPKWFAPDRDVARCQACLDKAVKYGVPRIMVVPPVFTKGGDREGEFQQVIVEFKKFIAQAKKRGITVTIEDFGGADNCCQWLKYMKRLLDEIPDLRVALDSGNFYYASHGDSVLDLMEYAGDRIAHIHLKDQTAQDSHVYASLGEGAVPNEKIVRTMSGKGYSGWWTLENAVGDTYDDTTKQIKVLKSWMAK